MKYHSFDATTGISPAGQIYAMMRTLGELAAIHENPLAQFSAAPVVRTNMPPVASGPEGANEPGALHGMLFSHMLQPNADIAHSYRSPFVLPSATVLSPNVNVVNVGAVRRYALHHPRGATLIVLIDVLRAPEHNRRYHIGLFLLCRRLLSHALQITATLAVMIQTRGTLLDVLYATNRPADVVFLRTDCPT